MDMFDEMAKQLGFKDAVEMHKLTSRVNLLDPEIFAAFNKWKMTDGTKAGLLPLLPEHLRRDTDE